MAKLRSLNEFCGLRVSVETNIIPEGPLYCMRCQRFGHKQRYCGYIPKCVVCGETHPSGESSTSQHQVKYCSWGGNHTANYQGRVKWTEAKAALAMRMPVERVKGVGASSFPLRQRRTEWSEQPSRRG